MNPADATTSELKRLFQQSSHYVFGLVATLAVGFVSFPVFTRAFSVADYGLIDFAQKVLLLLTALSKVGMQNSTMRFFDGEAFAGDAQKQRAYYSTMFFSVLVLASAVTAIFVLGLRLPMFARYDARLVAILSFASILILVRALQSILWSFLRVQEKTKLYNVTSFVMKAGTVAAVLVLFPLMGPTVRTYYTGTIVVETLLVVAVAMSLFRRSILRPSAFDGHLFRVSFAFGLPLVLQELFGIILDSGDRLLVQYYLGSYALGFYSVAYGLSTYLNTLLVAPLSLAIVPIYLRIWRTRGAEETTEFLSIGLDLFLLSAAAIMMVVVLVSHDAIAVLASAKYLGADRLIPFVVAGLLLYTAQVFLNAGLMIHKRTSVMAGVLGVSALVNVGLNCLLLPRLGLEAAALATFLSYGLCTMLLAHFAYKVLPLKIKAKSVAGYGVAGLAGWFIVRQVDLQIPIVNLVARSVLSLCLYIGILWLIDPRIRTGTADAWRWLLLTLRIGSIVPA